MGGTESQIANEVGERLDLAETDVAYTLIRFAMEARDNSDAQGTSLRQLGRRPLRPRGPCSSLPIMEKFSHLIYRAWAG